MIDVGKELARLRKEKGFTLKTLAIRAGTNRIISGISSMGN